jgi:hypothetical protein
MNFHDHHEVITLIGLTVFPRITLLVASFASGGLLWWLGWLFAPHLLVAFLSLTYWDTNPVLVVVAWLLALGGTREEAKLATKQIR